MKKKQVKKEKVVKAVILAIVALLIISIFLLLGAERGPEQNNADIKTRECSTDEECVPASCCHAASCVINKRAPQCSGVYCTQVCLPDTLDCGQARCACVEKRCRAVNNEDR